MRGLLTVTVVVAALSAVAAAPASAAIFPWCTTRLAPAPAGTSGCTFDSNTDWATITVAPVGGSVTATVRCTTTYGYTFTNVRNVESATSWAWWTPGTCHLSLTPVSAPVTAVATATPTPGPIFEQGPDPEV